MHSNVELVSDLIKFDTPHLIMLYKIFYDRWNWKSGNKFDKEIMDISEEILKQRGFSNYSDDNIAQLDLFSSDQGMISFGEDMKDMLSLYLEDKFRGFSIYSCGGLDYLLREFVENYISSMIRPEQYEIKNDIAKLKEMLEISDEKV